MATTTNYGWDTPDDTDLVKDGAAAIRTLGSSVDTTTKALNPSTTEGDIEYRSATADTNTRLGIGSTGDVLTVTGGVPVWAAPAGGGGMTSLASGSFPAAATLTLSSIDQTYKDLMLVVRNVYLTVDDDIKIKFNATATSNYPQIRRNAVNDVLTEGAGNGTAFIYLMGEGASIDNISGQYNNAVVNIYDYANTVAGKSFTVSSQFKNQTYGDKIINETVGSYSLNTAVTGITLTTGAGNFAGGTYILYGVN
jgi:hypothetical protein